MRRLLSVTGLLVFGAGCSANGVDGGDEQRRTPTVSETTEYSPCADAPHPIDVSIELDEVDEGLRAVEDCSVAERALRNEIAVRMSATLQRTQSDYQFYCFPPEYPAYDYCYSDYDYSSSSGSGDGSGFGNASAPSAGSSYDMAPPAPAALSDPAPRSTTGTNNQVQGVDEADFIKTDGRFFYIAGGGGLRIIQAWPPEQTREVGNVALEGEARKLFVDGDTALVYSALPSLMGAEESYSSVVRANYSGECNYGYDCEFSGDGTRTLVSLVDISDRTAPVVSRSYVASGSYLSSRRIGANVHTVLHQSGIDMPELTYVPEELEHIDPRTFSYDYDCGSRRYVCTGNCDFSCGSPEDVDAAFAALEERNRLVIETMPLEQLLPWVREVKRRTQVTGGCEMHYGGPDQAWRGDPTSFVSVLSLSLASKAEPQLVTLQSSPGPIHSSTEGMYLAVRGSTQLDDGSRETTLVHKLRFAETGVEYCGSGLVKGRVLNQFAMDEHEGFFRIAATTGRAGSCDTHSTLSILAESEGRLKHSAVVDGLAPGEDIRSVRFVEDRGFVVTFKKTDPLFVFDLADAYRPALLAELKVPGFSSYIHPVDDAHLLTIGYDADDQGSFGWFSGVLLQMFDISQPSDPKLAHREVIGTRGSSSTALTHHLAFTFAADRGLLSLPMTICEGGSSGSFGDQMTFSGLLVYRASFDAGFSRIGGVEHPVDANATCSNWWTSSSSSVTRSFIFDSFVYSVSDRLLKVNALGELDRDIASVPLD